MNQRCAFRPFWGLVAMLMPLVGCEHGSEAVPEPVLELLSPPILTGWVETADPALAVDPESGDLLLAWGGSQDGETWDLYMSRSTDGGDHFSPAVRVNHTQGALHPHAEGAPRLVAAPGVVALFWNNRAVVEGRRFATSDLLFARSLDGGRVWSEAQILQDPPVPAELPPRAHTFHGAAWAGDSTLVVAWLDGRDRDARRLARAEGMGVAPEAAVRTPEAFSDEADPHDGDAALYAAVSHDLGATWEEQNRKLLDGICPCCRVALARGPDGGVVGGWRLHLDGGIRDLAVGTLWAPGDTHTSTEASIPWSLIHEDGWEIAGCPHAGPGVAVDPSGTVHVTWYTGASEGTGVFYRTLSPALDGQASQPLPLVEGPAVGVSNPSLTVLQDRGAVVTTNVAADGRRVISVYGVSPEGREPTFALEIPDSEGGTHPQIVSAGTDRVVVAWTESRNGVQRVRLARLSFPDAASVDSTPRARSLPPVPGNPAPEWAGTTLAGETLSLTHYRGQVVLLNVWATWCAPCIREMPGLQALHDHFAERGVVVVGASVDRRAARDDVARFVDDLGIRFPILLDPDQQVMSRFRTLGVPETFLIDAEGIIRHRWIGEFDPMEPDVLARVETLLTPAPRALRPESELHNTPHTSGSMQS